MEKISYKGWKNCYRLKNDQVELIITGDVGPRIIHFGFIGDWNEFCEFPDMLGKTGGDEWRIYGGHRLWHAPEAQPRTYFPDNEPVSVELNDPIVQVVQPTETTTGIQKEMDIYLDPDGAHVRITHRLINNGLWGVELAPWALSVMAPGGKVIIPLPPRGSHTDGDLLPANLLTLWSYTNLADPRWYFGRKYIMLRQDPSLEEAQKIGVLVPDGWAAYANRSHLFVKTFNFMSEALYPDFGCSVETFTNADFIELETLGPLSWLEPGEMVEHEEDWFLFKGVPLPKSDSDIDRDILPKVQTIEVY